MILVLGSTGMVGSRVVAGLVAAGEQVRALTRGTAPAAWADPPFAGAVEVVTGDLGKPETVQAAVAGADAVFVLSTGPDALAHELAVAGAVRCGGTTRVVKLSSVAALPPIIDAYGGAHATAERAFAQSGASWTTLRAAGFMSNVLYWAYSIKSDGVVYQPYAGVLRAVIDPADVAAVAVACLTGDGHGHDGKSYQLTGPVALTAFEQAAKLSAVLGTPIEVVDIDREQAVAGMTVAGMPRDFAISLLDSWADTDPRRGGTPLPTVQQILGRPPVTFDAWLDRNLPQFAS
jgi:uncharacterized protein YbjT (DUF2867 family)